MVNPNLKLSDTDFVIETKVKINDTLKEIRGMSKKDFQSIYEDTVNMCLHTDLINTFTGKAIKELYGEEAFYEISQKAAENYNEAVKDGISLVLSEEDEKMFKECLNM